MIAARAWSALACAFAFASAVAPAQPPVAGEAHRQVAWRLAMLAERMGKLHAQAGQGLLPQRARRALAEATQQFDVLVRQSQGAAPTPEARDDALLLGLLWREYRPWLSRPATRENARRLGERTEELAWVALKGARMTGAGRSAPAAEAAWGCVLAQRVARLLLLRRWDVRDDASTRALASAEQELRAVLERLGAMPGNSVEIAAELRVAQNQHVFLERASRELAAQPTLPQALEIVAKTGDNLLESLARVGRLYESEGLSASTR
jgi:hypothetical protein